MVASIAAQANDSFQLERVNTLLGEGVKQSVMKLEQDGKFLPFVYMLGSNMLNRQAQYGDEKGYESDDNYKEAVSELVTIVAKAKAQGAVNGYLLFATTEASFNENKTKGITVFIESEGVKPRQMFYPYSFENEELKILNPVEMTYAGTLFK